MYKITAPRKASFVYHRHALDFAIQTIWVKIMDTESVELTIVAN